MKCVLIYWPGDNGSGLIKTIWTIITKQFEKSEFVKTIWTIITKRFEEKKRVRQNSLHNYHQTIWEKQVCHRKYLNQKPVHRTFYAFSFNPFLQRKEIFFQPVATKKGDLAKLLQIGFCKISECGTNMVRKLKYLNVEQIWAENWTKSAHRGPKNVISTLNKQLCLRGLKSGR